MTVDELPKNYISFRTIAWVGDNKNRVNVTATQEKYDLGSTAGGAMGGVTLTLSGGGLAFNNIQPVIAVYCWLRTA
nr:MAG TPA: Baseplate structural protein [Caudoviricetes sp.]